MNTLKLKVTSYHRLTPGQVVEQSFNENGGSIGRSGKSDWVLPDPDKVISSVHAYISYQAGNFYITDNSTNGLFVNRSVQPLGKGNSQVLSDGDYLQLGDYEIEAAIEARSAAPVDISVQQPVQQPVAQNTVDDEPLMETHAEALSQDPYAENFTPPMAQIPEDWDEKGRQDSGEHMVEPQKEQISMAPQPDVGEVESQPRPTEASVIPQPLHRPQQREVKEQPVQQPPVQPIPQASTPAQTVGATQGASYDSIKQEQAKSFLTAFLNAAGLREEDLPRDLSPSLFEAMGGALRFSLQGMLDILRARSDMKSEFRVMQTTIRTQENNPLKFSINVDEAMRNLFLRQVPGFLPWFQAIESCFKDMSSHELALMAGTQGALQGVLDTLDPEEIARANQNGSALHKVVPAAKKAKLWDVFVTLHQEVQSEVGQDSEKTFSEDFAAAYEAQLRKLGAS